MCRINLIVILLLFAGLSYAQDPATEYNFYKEKYPDESAVMLKNNREYIVDIVGDSLQVRINHYKEILILGDVISVHTKDKIYADAFSEVKDIKAQTLVPGKRKYKEIDVTNFKETFDQSDYIFYDDSKSISFTYPAVQTGAKTVLSYTQIIKDPHFSGSFFSASYIPVEEAKYRIIIDPKVDMEFVKFHMDGMDYKEEDLIEKGDKIKIFTLKNIPKVVYEDYAPTYNYLAPHIGTRIAGYLNAKGDSVSILKTPEDLFKWYWTFVDGLKTMKDKNVQQIVDEVVAGETSEYEKVQKIFYWVQENVKYIAFEQGMRGFIPHPGNYVCEKRYGDCKDMASIIINMLYHAGIDAYFTWVGSRDLPYKYTEFPSPSSDNHMIATYFHNGEPIYLDATGQFIPFGFPTSMIQGKEALIALNKDSFLIETVPVLPMEANVTLDSSFYTLKNGSLTGMGKTFMYGYSKIFSIPYLTRADKKAVDDYVKIIIMRGSNKFTADAYNIGNISNYQLPAIIDYSFTVPDYYHEVGNEIYVNLNTDKNFGGKFIDDNRRYPFENTFKYSIRNISVVEIPADYKIKFIPEDASHSTPIFHYKMSYKVQGQQIILEKEYGVNYLMLEKSDFKTWNEAFKKMSTDNRQAVILEKIN